MIEALNSVGAEPRQGPAKAGRTDKDADAPFSLALAAAALEHRAGAALKAFGAAPTESAPTAIGNADESPRANKGGDSRARSAPAPADAAQADATDAPVSPAKPTEAHSSPVLPGAGQETRAQNLAPPSARTNAGVVNAAASVQPRVAEAATPRDLLAARQLTDGQKAPRAAARLAHPTREDFAKLLARRLESGASRFDIRLNPPELGRVEAKLTVGDDGKATLALSFDNQAALDLFARDETALRAAIASSGFEFGAGDLAFTLERRGAPAPSSAAPTPLAAAEPSQPQSAEPLFVAPYSRGVIDLRV